MNIKNMIKDSNGEIVKVEITKADGTLRKMTCKTGVTEFLKGGTNKVEAPDRPYVTVYDTDKEGYRTINADTVSSLWIGSKKIV